MKSAHQMIVKNIEVGLSNGPLLLFEPSVVFVYEKVIDCLDHWETFLAPERNPNCPKTRFGTRYSQSATGILSPGIKCALLSRFRLFLSTRCRRSLLSPSLSALKQPAIDNGGRFPKSLSAPQRIYQTSLDHSARMVLRKFPRAPEKAFPVVLRAPPGHVGHPAGSLGKWILLPPTGASRFLLVPG